MIIKCNILLLGALFAVVRSKHAAQTDMSKIEERFNEMSEKISALTERVLKQSEIIENQSDIIDALEEKVVQL